MCIISHPVNTGHLPLSDSSNPGVHVSDREGRQDLMAIKSSELLIVEHTDKIDHGMGALNTKVAVIG